MVRHGLGSTNDRLKSYNPEAMLRDDKTAIVEVYAYLPPGGRAGQRIDVFVQAQHNSQTKSLARGHLYQTSLFVGGADPLNPAKSVNPFVKAAGAVFVTLNPRRNRRRAAPPAVPAGAARARRSSAARRAGR